MRNLLASTLLVCAMLYSTSSYSAFLEWTLDGPILFNDGSQLSGSFFYDADTNIYGANTFSLSCGTVCLDPVDPFSIDPPSDANNIWAYTIDGNSESIRIVLGFLSSLTSAGGTVAIGYPAHLDNLTTLDGAWGNVGNQTVTASVVPLPAAAWLFGSALAGLGWLRRKA